ncbi:aminoglycoside phosphotransferase family protein [Candidatus Woesearchaeota archaeon]|nr:aminoglycoside phosphotransferase family protein [Candidatus Woesearchaeota archaeon]
MQLNKNRVETVCKKVFKRCSLVSVREITEAGRVNHLFDVKIKNPAKSLILKIYPKKWEHYKPEKEKFVFELIKSKTKLPVPEIYILDKSKKIIPNTYILMNKAEGKMLKFAKIPKKEKTKLFFQLGKDLARLQSIKFDSFGWIYKDKISKYELKYSKPCNSMKKYFQSAYEEIKDELYSAKNKKYGKIDKKSFLKLIPQIDEFVKEHLNLLDSSIKPVFIHNDFLMENILVQKNKHWKISCILDVELSKAADSEFELERYFDPVIFNNQGYSKAFIRGYNSIKKPSKNFFKKKKLYGLIRMLSWASFDGFVLRNAKQGEMDYWYRHIQEFLNGRG